MTAIRALAIWFLFIPAMIVNGWARESILTQSLGDLHAHQISCLTGSALILSISCLCIRWLGLTATRGLLATGLGWLCLTIAFEFTFGLLVAGAAWDRLLADYNLAAGRLWLLVLGTTLLAPLIAARLRLPISQTPPR